MTILIGSHYRPCDYRFARTRSDGLPLERSAPPLSPPARLVGALALALASFGLMAIVSLIGDWLL